ncbi:MAG: 16S rRNA (guanine(527)-N(7))-methyltransferase RsmG [Pseudomonadota bacterium]
MISELPFNVSRETLERLRHFQALVEKWTRSINLVSKSSLGDLWQRHIIDSAQLFSLAPTGGRWVDLGSGGGFPGLVVAILTADTPTPHQVTLVESDQRKCAFLRTAIQTLSLAVTVNAARIEQLQPLHADIISARALAELDMLLAYAHRHLSPAGVALLPKGAKWQDEEDVARKRWSYDCERINSRTHAEAAILRITNIRHD